MIDKVIGVGEIAIADYRSSKPSVAELARIVSELAGRRDDVGQSRGNPLPHGAGKEKLGILHKLLDEYRELPPHVLHATHITRSTDLIEDAVRLAKRGAYVDMDTIGDDFGRSFVYYRDHEGPLDHLTVSSDAGAGTSDGVHTLYNAFVQGLRDFHLPLEQILPCWTSNTARCLSCQPKDACKRAPTPTYW